MTCLNLILLLLLSMPLLAKDFYVSPFAGRGDGSPANPWPAAAVCTGMPAPNHQPAAVTAEVSAGRAVTIWWRGGRYYSMSLHPCRPTGSAKARITMSAYPGEDVVIDGVGSNATAALILDPNGNYTDWIGFEVTNSAPVRSYAVSGSIQPPGFSEGVDFQTPNSRLINFIIHDNDQGVGFWSPATNSAIYGSIIYNNGHDAPDRGHGHGIYAQNNVNTGTKTITSTIVGTHFDADWHLYTEQGQLWNFALSKDITFRSGHCVFGGSPGIHNLSIDRSFWYSNDPAYFEIYYGGATNTGLSFTNNYVLQGIFQTLNWTDNALFGNTFWRNFGATYKFDIRSQTGQSIAVTADNNRWVRSTPTDPYIGSIQSNGVFTGYNSFAQWQATGYDPHGSQVNPPTLPEITYDPNLYEAGRCHITVVNWAKSPGVDLDFSKCGLSSRDVYNLWEVQDLGGPPIYSGQYAGGTIRVDMTETGYAPPAGSLTPQCWNTGCNTCSPIPAGCSTHSLPTFKKSSSLYRVFLLRKT